MVRLGWVGMLGLKCASRSDCTSTVGHISDLAEAIEIQFGKKGETVEKMGDSEIVRSSGEGYNRMDLGQYGFRG